MAQWDPIGVRHEPLAASEYDSYMLPLARKLREGASATDVATFLDEAKVRIGLGETPRDTTVAGRIVRWYAKSTQDFIRP